MSMKTNYHYRLKALTALTMVLAVAALVALAALGAGPAEAEKKSKGGGAKIVFASDRTTGKGVDNPEGDDEIFVMNSKEKKPKQITRNGVNDYAPTLSPDGKKVAYHSEGAQTSNPEGDSEVYLINASGTNPSNFTNNAVGDSFPTFSPDGQKIAYMSFGKQSSNPEGDYEVYVMNALDGSDQTNHTNNAAEVADFNPVFSPDGQKIAYTSSGVQLSNFQGDNEVYLIYLMNASGSRGEGDEVTPGGLAPVPTNKINLTHNDSGVGDFDPVFSPDGQRIAYTSQGIQSSNPEGDNEVYAMNTLDGSDQQNLTNNGASTGDYSPVFSPAGQKIAYTSQGEQTSNPEKDPEVYLMNANGTNPSNLTNNGAFIEDGNPRFSPDGKRLAYTSGGVQTSNPEGDLEIYLVNALGGSDPLNLTNNDADDDSHEWGGPAKKR